MNSQQAKQIRIENLLSKLGYSPVRKDKRGEEWVYNSPFRNEKEPSLFVNVKKNVWNDFGDMGGNILDFVMRHENTDFKGALFFLEGLYSNNAISTREGLKTNPIGKKTEDSEAKFILDGVMPLKSPILESYLRERGINIAIAKIHLKTVQFHHTKSGSKYFAFGMKNLSNDYEIRNPKLKAVIGKKDISFIKGKRKVGGEAPPLPSVAVFEGFIDFLSYMSDKNYRTMESDTIILNSAKLVERAKELINKNQYQQIYTFFDNDKAGNEARTSFDELERKIIHCNHVYEGFKDYNEYWQSQKQNNIQK